VSVGGAAAGDVVAAGSIPRERLGLREWMPLLAATVRARGQRVPARPAAPGLAAGRLVPCRPHERPPASGLDAILLVDHPVPALAPLLFTARGLIARTGAAGSHLAEVARSLAVPMVTGCRVPAGSTGASWLAAVDGTSGEVTLLPV
jgi:phosphohistidine swiveling domain-containing protein